SIAVAVAVRVAVAAVVPSVITPMVMVTIVDGLFNEVAVVIAVLIVRELTGLTGCRECQHGSRKHCRNESFEIHMLIPMATELDRLCSMYLSPQDAGPSVWLVPQSVQPSPSVHFGGNRRQTISGPDASFLPAVCAPFSSVRFSPHVQRVFASGPSIAYLITFPSNGSTGISFMYAGTSCSRLPGS